MRQLAGEIERLAHAIGVPSSPCLTTNAFCASVNFDAFMPRIFAPPRKSTAEISSCEWSKIQVTGQRYSRKYFDTRVAKVFLVRQPRMLAVAIHLCLLISPCPLHQEEGTAKFS